MPQNLQNLEDELQKELEKSPTALGSGTAPTQKDISINQKLLSIRNRQQMQTDKVLQEKWYADEEGNQKKRVSDPSKMVPRDKPKIGLKSALHALGIPLYTIVGATEAALGKGTKKGVYENIKSNIEEGGTFGDLLRQYGAGGAGSLVGGLALDIALDPVNWVTLGAEAFIPRIAYGGMKGGAEGLKIGAKSVGLDIAKTVTKPADWVGLADKRKSLTKLASNTKEYYNELTGRTMEQLLESRGVVRETADLIAPGLANKAGSENSFYRKYFKLDPQGWFRNKKFESEQGSVMNAEEWSKKQLAKGKLFETRDRLDEAAKEYVTRPGLEGGEVQSRVLSGSPEELITQVHEVAGVDPSKNQEYLDAIKEELMAMQRGPSTYAKVRTVNAANEAADLMTDLSPMAWTFDPDQARDVLNSEFLDQLALKLRVQDLRNAGIDTKEAAEALSAVKSLAKDKTGWKLFDDTAEKFREMYIVKDKVKGEQIMKGYKTFIDAFKQFAIGKFSSISLAMLSNATMTNMHGVSLTPEFAASVMKAFKAAINVVGKGDEAASIRLLDLFNHPEFKEFADNYPELFHSVFKVRPDLLTNPQAGFYEILTNYLQDSKMAGMTKSQMDEIREKTLQQLTAKNKMIDADLDTTFISRELAGDSYWKDWMGNLKAAAEDKNNIGARALNWYLNKPVKWFEATDQAYKIGLASHLVKNGVSDSELLIMNKFSPMQIGIDVFKNKDTGKWTLSGLKAADFANDVYMNYAAMPAAVKVLRSLPVVGMPFASFMYGMLTKTGRTAMYNPAFFNRVQFALNELNGGRSPLEKKSLSQPYYQWMKDNGMVSLPFFRDNPVYMNMASFLPYFTMNIFDQTERRTENTLGGNIVKIVDSMPILKTPEGQLIMDYFIVPTLLRDTNPTGIFDQPLYPQDASAAVKAGYFARSLGETVAPLGNAAILGAVTPEAALDYVPSYKFRKLGYAVRGKTAIGKSTKESRVGSTMRSIMSAYTGLGFYPLNIKYSNTNQ